VLAAAWITTAPLPVPEAPEITVIHPELLVAVQAHPAGAFTTTLFVPAAAPKAPVDGAIE
jgi:hypothetical protein